MLEKHETVMRAQKVAGGGRMVLLEEERDPDKIGQKLERIYIGRQEWLDMGRPMLVTVTVQPGDQLSANDEEE